MLDSIQNDHTNIAMLLKVLEHKLDLIRGEQAVKYKLIADIISYLRDYSDQYHHPKEDVIYDYFCKYRATDSQISERLKDEHIKLRELTLELGEVVELILLDAVIPLDQFSQKLERFISAQWDHLNYEEDEIIPLLKASLTEDDWRSIEQDWQHNHVDDPLFGSHTDKQYQALAERIKISES
ncbi:hemerythrin domain-containing protein [Celerinatantimonas sp. YJH-8]|uniref:hemerythrin domain-containing protein n=1 Tax=Celerinatantimonas sp. YJH-8 TaxID=3228714 RepID=UPI0038C371DA